MKYFARKFGFFLATLWAVVTLNFLIPRLQPGDPAEMMVKKLAGKDAQLDPAQVRGHARHAGHARRLASRAVRGPTSVTLVRGNFGLSYTYYPFKVTEVIGQAFWWTVVLVGVTQVLVLRRRHRSSGRTPRGGATPRFDSRRHARLDVPRHAPAVLDRPAAPLRLRLRPRLVPDLGRLRGRHARASTAPSSQEAVSHSFLPAVALLIVTPIGWILGMRNTMIMNLGEDYIRLAKAKGLPDRAVALRYAARNALLPERHRLRARARRRARRRDPRRDRSSTTRAWAGSWARRSATRTTRCCRP